MTIEDFPVSYDELEPYFDHFEYVCGTSGKAGVINGQRVDGGNPFEGSRKRDFPLGPNPNYLGADVVYHSTQHLTDADLSAIAVYLKTLPAGKDDRVAYVADRRTADELRNGIDPNRGAELYVDSCAACHATSGLGRVPSLPAIAGNSTVLAPDPASLIRLVLAGSELPSTNTAPSPLGMPAFGWRLSDAETAELLTFVRNSWGNRAPAVTAGAVATIRATPKKDDVATR